MERRKGYYLIIPAIIIMCIFTLYPLIDGIRVSFTDKSMLRPDDNYIGIDNYKQLVDDPIFWISLRNSIKLTIIVVILQLFFGLILAWTLKQDIPGMPFFKSIIMASWVIPVAATVTIFKFMAQPDVGFINIILQNIGLGNLVKYWFGDPRTAFSFIVILHLWRNVPFYGITFFAAMQTIPDSFYEAAEIDGANAFQNFWYVTLPGIKNMIIIMVTIHVLWTFNNFEFIYLATGGGPINRTDVLPVYVYRQSWVSYAAGYGASIGTIMLLILSIYMIIYLIMQERGEYQQ